MIQIQSAFAISISPGVWVPVAAGKTLWHFHGIVFFHNVEMTGAGLAEDRTLPQVQMLRPGLKKQSSGS